MSKLKLLLSNCLNVMLQETREISKSFYKVIKFRDKLLATMNQKLYKYPFLLLSQLLILSLTIEKTILYRMN